LLRDPRGVEVSRVRIESPDLALEEGAAQPLVLGPAAKVRGVFVNFHASLLGLLDGFLEDRPLRAGLFGDPGEVLRGVEVPEEGADAVAEEPRVFVRAVEAGDDAALGEEGLDLGARDAQEGAEEAVLAVRVDAAQSAQAAAGEEAHQHGLGLVVLLMGRGHVPRALFVPDARQLRVAHLARGGLDAALAHAPRVERAVGDAQRDAEAAAEVAHERLVGIRVGAAEMVVDVRGQELEAEIV
jgi:hypothetical protein